MFFYIIVMIYILMDNSIMIGSILGNAAKMVATAGAAQVIGEAVKLVIKKVTDDKKTESETPTETIFDKDNATKLVKSILNHSTGNLNLNGITDDTQKEARKIFLLKLGVYLKDGKDTLSETQVKTLQKNIKSIDEHLENFGFTKQPISTANDLVHQFHNFIKKNITEQDKQPEDLKKERLAERVYHLFNASPTENVLDPKNYIEPYRLEKLLEPIKNATSEEPFRVKDLSVLTTIIYAEVFQDNPQEDDEKRTINYQEFIEKIKLPDGVGISKSDFDKFQKGEEILDFTKKNYKMNLETSDFDNNNYVPPPKGVKVLLDDSFFDNVDNINDNCMKYIQENAKNIYINIKHADKILQTYKNIVKKCGANSAKEMSFLPEKKEIKPIIESTLEIFTNKNYGNLVAELLKSETDGSTITDILKKEKNIDFNDIKNIIDCYKKIDNKNTDALFAFIKNIATDNLSFENTEPSSLIAKAILCHLGKNKDDKDAIFQAIIADYESIKTDYPDIMKKIFATEMKNYEEAGEHFTDIELQDIFTKLENNDFMAIKNKSPKTQTYIYENFLKSSAFKNLKEKTEKTLTKHKDNLKGNKEIELLIQQELQTIPQTKTTNDTSKLNSLFNTKYNETEKDSPFSINKLIFERNMWTQGKEDRVKAYKKFIEKLNAFNKNPEKPKQKLAKLIMVHKLKSEIESVKNTTAKQSRLQADPNPKLNEEINALVSSLPSMTKDTINDDLQKYLGEGVTVDSISSEQMKLLMNWVA